MTCCLMPLCSALRGHSRGGLEKVIGSAEASGLTLFCKLAGLVVGRSEKMRGTGMDSSYIIK